MCPPVCRFPMVSVLTSFLLRVGLIGAALSGANYLAVKLDDSLARQIVRCVRLLTLGVGILLCLDFLLLVFGEGLTWGGFLHSMGVTARKMIQGVINPF